MNWAKRKVWYITKSFEVVSLHAITREMDASAIFKKIVDGWHCQIACIFCWLSEIGVVILMQIWFFPVVKLRNLIGCLPYIYRLVFSSFFIMSSWFYFRICICALFEKITVSWVAFFLFILTVVHHFSEFLTIKYNKDPSNKAFIPKSSHFERISAAVPL